MTDLPNVKWATAYARKGLAVFPCKPGEKVPATRNGFHDATTDLDQVEKWWTAQPDANIGIALGASGLFAVDIDGPSGDDYLADLEDRHGRFPPTWWTATHNGVHWWFRQPQGTTVPSMPQSRFGAKFEIKGDGGYLVVPPSAHPAGGVYEWGIGPKELEGPAEAPQWLVDHLTAPTVDHDAERVVTRLTVGREGDRHRKRLDGLADKVATTPEGDRNFMLNWAAHKAGRMVAAGHITEGDAIDVLSVAGERAGLTRKEMFGSKGHNGTIHSGLQAGIAAGPEPDDQRFEVAAQLSHSGRAATNNDSAVEAGDPFDHAVAIEVAKIQVRDAARRIIAKERTPDHAKAEGRRLDELVAVEWPDAKYRIDGWQLTNGRNLIAAQYKAGKTTLVGNLVRSLVDGERWLGVADVEPVDGRVVVFDFEMHERQLAEWYSDLGIAGMSNVVIWPMRGKQTQFDIIDPAGRAEWAQRLRADEAAYVILDPLGPVVKAFGLSEDKDLGMYLGYFDALLTEADVKEATVVHHMGHNLERGRGDSAQRGWPDAEIRLIRDGDEPNAGRFITAYGRDVDRPEGRLTFDPQTRRLALSGGSRADEQLKIVAAQVYAYLDGLDPESEDGRSGRAVEEHFKGDISRVHVRDALKYGIHLGEVTVKPGARNATLHYR